MFYTASNTIFINNWTPHFLLLLEILLKAIRFYRQVHLKLKVIDIKMKMKIIVKMKEFQEVNKNLGCYQSWK